MKLNSWRFSIALVTLSFTLAFIIHSCKKDNAQEPQKSISVKNKNSIVREAKSWFQKNAEIHQKKTVNTISESREWFDGLNPAWDSTQVYARGMDTLMEMPLLNSAVAFTINSTTASLQSNYTKTTYLLEKDSVGVFKGWFMVLIADTAYVNGNFSKIDDNTYRKRDAAYSGRLLYFDINGRFAGGWRYENGIITKTLSITNAASSVSPQINSDRPKSINSVSCSTNTVTTTTWACVDAGPISNPKTVASIKTNAYCTPYTTTKTQEECTYGSASGGGGGGGSSSNGNNNNTFPPPTNPNCPTPAPAAIGDKHINMVPQPSPGPCNVTPQPEPPKIVVDSSLTKNFPCALKLIINKLAQNPDYSKFISPFISSLKPDLTWNNTQLSWNSPDPMIPGSTNTYKMGQTSYSGRSATVTLNTSMLQNSSQLMIAATIIHESIHAYINYNIQTYTQQFAVPANFSTEKPWLYALDVWTIKDGIPPNFRDHDEMLTFYFNQAVSALKTWDNGAHTDKEYAMTMLYGLSTGDFLPMQSSLAKTYSATKAKYSITDADLQTYWKSQINSKAGKLPTSGC